MTRDASRYFGILASHSQWRGKIILRPGIKKGFVASADDQAPKRMTCVSAEPARERLMARVFKTDITRCKTCSRKFHPENSEIVTNPPLVAAILIGLGLNAVPLPRGPPRRRQGLLFDPDVDQSQPDYD